MPHWEVVFTDRRQRLPLEVLTSILEFLPQPDLRLASSASRDFYDAAHAAGLELHRTIEVGGAHDSALNTFLDIVDHISAKERHMDVALTLNGSLSPDSSSALLPVLPALARALPLLTRLEARVASDVCADFYTTLVGPAPRLRALIFWQISSRDAPVPLPPALFGAGSAPRLADVTLVGSLAAPDAVAVAAFARVRTLALYSGCAPPAPLARAFPALRALRLSINVPFERENGPGVPVDLTGLALQRLVICGNAPLAFSLLSPVPRVEYVCEGIAYDGALWPARGRALAAHIRCLSASTALLFSAFSTTDGEGWRLTISSAAPSWLETTATERGLQPLARLPPLHTQLVSLTLDERILAKLVGTPYTFAALRELFVDCIANANPKPDNNADGAHMDRLRKSRGLVSEYFDEVSQAFALPALRTVTAFVRAGTGTKTVEGRKLAALGVALGASRAELVLAGVVLPVHDPALELLLAVYAAVRVRESGEGVVPEYCDYRTTDDRSLLRF